MLLRRIALGLAYLVMTFSTASLRAEDAPKVPTPAAEQPAKADAAPAKEGVAKDAPANDKEPLASSQELLTRRYKRFVDTLKKVAENVKKTNPEQAELINRAIGKSNADGLPRRMDELVEKLAKREFGTATEDQEEVVAHLQELLQLLISEDEKQRNKAEQQRIEAYLKKLNEIIHKEKDVRAATERKENPDDLAARQKKIQEQTNNLNKQIANDDAAKNQSKSSDPKAGDPKAGEPKPGDPKAGDPKSGEPKPGDPKPGDPKPGDPKEGDPKDPKPGDAKPGDPKDPKDTKPMDPKPGDPKPGDPKPGDPKPGDPKPGDPKEGEPKPGDPKPGDPMPGDPMPGDPKDGKPMDGKPMKGKPKPGDPKPGESGDSKPQQSEPPEETPGREELEKAKQEMEKAIENLKKKAHDKASDNQDEVLKELQKAKEKLEEILRQLREEEKIRTLQALEARFRKMLEMQVQVYDGTVRLDKVIVDQRTSAHAARSHDLARKEEEIVVEATRALTLLREEGSAVAFPEATEQIRDDMQSVAGWLGKDPNPDTGTITQAVEKDIIEALEEMIDALQKEIEKAKDKKDKKQQQQDQQQEDDQALIDLLGELKLLRALQNRVNRRTAMVGRMVKGEQATDPKAVDQLKILGDRQARIQKATYDLASGKNK